MREEWRRPPGRYVHIVATGVRHGHGLGIRQSRRFFDGQRIHVGAQHDHRPVAVAQKSDHASLADASRHIKARGAQPFRRDIRRSGLAHGQLRMRVNVFVERLQIRQQIVKMCKRGIGSFYRRLCHVSIPPPGG